MMNYALNHLWQSTLFALAASLLTMALKREHSHARYWVWLTASVKFLIPFALLAKLGGSLPWHRIPSAFPGTFSLVIDHMSGPFRVSTGPASTAQPFPWIQLLLAVWLCGCLSTLVVWRLRWCRIQAALEIARPLTEGREFEALRRVQSVSPVRLVCSPSSLEPGVFGILHPVLMLPAGIADHLTDAQLDAILAHELCHIRRRDNLAAALHMFVEALFWFHPLVWWLGSRLVDEREQACDAAVLKLGSEPEIYAESILKVCQFYLESPLQCASGITGTNLKQRVKDIMRPQAGTHLDFGRKLLLGSAAFAAIVGPILLGVQTANGVPTANLAHSFAAASIQPVQQGLIAEGQSRHAILISPAGLTITNMTLGEIIQFAYGVPSYRISGPGWLTSQRYNVFAKTSVPVPLASLKLMAQTMLEQRFKLALHREKVKKIVYALVAGSHRPSLMPAQGSEKLVRVSHAGLVFRNLSLREFAGRLSDLRPLDRPLVDHTGIPGTFDITMDAAPGASIVTAIQNQLGLKLESQTQTLEILVVDHAGKTPIAN